jgi:hypothetical protein
MIERALYAELVASGVDPDATFINLWQVANPREARFPQIVGACSPDVPQGVDTDSFSVFRVVHGSLRAASLVEDDPDRVQVVALYVQIRTALEAANSTRASWQTGSLAVDALVVTECPVPMVEQVANGAFVFVMEVNFDVFVSVT